MNCNSSLGEYLVDAAEALVLSSSCGWYGDGLECGRQYFFQFYFTIPVFLWRGITNLGSHIRFVPSIVYPGGNSTLSCGVLAALKQSFLWTLIS